LHLSDSHNHFPQARQRCVAGAPQISQLMIPADNFLDSSVESVEDAHLLAELLHRGGEFNDCSSQELERIGRDFRPAARVKLVRSRFS
jgi:hypothetical protein